MNIALSSDHAGFHLLDELETYLHSLGHEVKNLGPTTFDSDDDYPDYIFPAANSVATGACDRAIILGGSGQGEAMAANRIKGVRAAVFYGPVIAKSSVDISGNTSEDPYEIITLSRQHNDANVLSLSSRFLTSDEMKQAIRLWLETPFSNIDRHTRRIQKLDS